MREPTRVDRQMISELRGWLHNKEGVFLYGLASIVPAGSCIVELGSYLGKSTVSLALGSKRGGKAAVYSVDPQVAFVGAAGVEYDGPVNKAAYYENVVKYGVGELVYTVNLRSDQAAGVWETGVGLVFIDGDHRKVEEDFLLWDRHLSLDGLMVFHDTTWKGVGEFAASVEGSPRFERFGKCRSTLALRKLRWQ